MNTSPIAIVGMAGHFPGARNIDEFWKNLRDGVESIRTLSDAELLAAGVSAEELANPDYVKAAAILNDVDMFDPSFFGFTPRDASIMDPQHRHFLECSWEALENAGHTAEGFSGSIGVFAGSGMNAYMVHNLLNNRRLMESAGLFLIRQSGNDKDVLATRVSYQLDLRGPSLSVQTACSTSLVAVHLACQSLLNCECDMALAGGVTIEIPHSNGYVYRKGEILSRDGHCRSFDANSSGTVFSSGVGIVVLRRLSDAIADRDTIHAVILGSAINNDGQRKVGYLAPSVAGQAEVISEALGVAGVEADSISYVETHGTGTMVGDPIEIKGLSQAFRKQTNRKGYCAIGSLKSNVGHLDTAAGVAGLIKSVLALKNRQLPASLNFQKPNPQIDFQNTPFYVNQSLSEWKANGTLRRAGVTSLGIGGTNAHVVLEEAPEHVRAQTKRPYQLIPLSAKTETALLQVTDRLAAHLRENPGTRLEDIAFTYEAGRMAFAHRRVIVAANTADAIRALSDLESARNISKPPAASKSPPVAFLFSGQGSQYSNMAADLYACEPVFRDNLDACADKFQPHLGLDLRKIIYPSVEDSASAAERLICTSIAQPALFTLEYSLAQWWMALGVRPRAMLGHSLGEYVAACIAGVMSLDDVIAVTAKRGQLMQGCAPGSMLAVALAQKDLLAALSSDVSVAAYNAPQQCVVSGPSEAIAELEKKLSKKGVICHKLQTSHAFHSAMMDQILSPFIAEMKRVKLRAPTIPYLSNNTGTWITAAQATDPEYWALHLRNTVRFSDCITELLRDSDRVMLEVGPGHTLASLVQQHMSAAATPSPPKVFVSVRRREEPIHDSSFLLQTLGKLWIAGQTVNWSALQKGESAMRIPLPTYPFERQRFWINADPKPVLRDPEPPSAVSELVAEREVSRDVKSDRAPISKDRLEKWFYQRRWTRATQPATNTSMPINWMVFLDSNGLGTQIGIQLRNAGHHVVEVSPGSHFKSLGRGKYTIRPGVRVDYDNLMADVIEQGNTPQKIIHLWPLRAGNSQSNLDEKLDLSFYSLLFLSQSIGDQDFTGINIAVVSDRLHSIEGEPILDPVCSVLLGPTKVISKEFPGISCRNIDVNMQNQGLVPLAGQIISEQSTSSSQSVVALRRGERWIERLEHVYLRASSNSFGLKQNGVYLITGGLGDLALVIAEDLARNYKARLVLLARTPLPPEEKWKSALDSSNTSDRLKDQIRKLIEIKALGGDVVVVAGDVCRNEDAVRAIEISLKRFGAVNGVIHAAGVVEDSPLLIKSRESAARVLDPKIMGTLVLDASLKETLYRVGQKTQLDFFALFSSVSSHAAPAGQIDYTAANAFLDSFAVSRAREHVVAINWGPWRDVGMAARVTSHPLLGRRIIDTADEIAYSALLGPQSHWVMAEHRMNSGESVFPGTGYLEMASAALTRGSFDRVIEFEEVFFHAPLTANPGEKRPVQVDLHRGGNGVYQFSIRALDTEWTEHATGMIAQSRKQPPANQDIDQIVARCRSRKLAFDDSHRTKQEKFFEFGLRWRCLKTLQIGEMEALATLELHNSFYEDTSDYNLHPALLDLATGSALYLIDGYERSSSLYFPMFYKRATFYHRIPSSFFSHIRSRQMNEATGEVAMVDFTLLDKQGHVLAEIEGFSMRRVSDPLDITGIVRPSAAETSALKASAPDRLSRCISPAQGALAFTRILTSEALSVVFVLPDGPVQATQSRKSTAEPIAAKSESMDQIESRLTQLWQELLGYEHIALDDDFFDLGGQSLIVVRLISKIKKTFGVDLALSTLFEARTIRKLAELIREVHNPMPTKPKVGRGITTIQPKGMRIPLFVVSGLTGNVIEYLKLSSYLGEDQPVYGLIPRGTDGHEAFEKRVEDIAAYYVDAIRNIQTEGPYRLVGHSFGGTVAFEVAQQLIARGEVVSFLGLFDTIEWHYREQAKRTTTFRERLVIYLTEPKELLKALSRTKWKIVRAISPIFHALGKQLREPEVTISEAHERAGANYQPKIYPGRLSLFRSASRRKRDGDDKFLGWGKLVTGGIDVYPVPADHYDIIREPAVKLLSARLRECLDRDEAPADTTLQLSGLTE